MAQYNENNFYEIINEALNMSVEEREWPFYAMDYIASRAEWERFKDAMARWLKDMETEVNEGFDQADAEAREAEHELE